MLNRTALRDIKLKVLDKLPPSGESVSLKSVLSEYAAQPSGDSLVRAGIMELKEEGQVVVDLHGNVTRTR